MYYYIYKICNFFLDIYYKNKSKVFFIQDIKTSNNNKKTTLFKLYMFYYFNFFINCMPLFIKNRFNNLFNNFDNNSLIKLQFTNGRINRNIIYKNISSFNLSKNIKLNYSDQNFFNENELMMLRRHVVLDIFYRDISNNKISIKNLISDYADKSKNFTENKIKNILILENININRFYLTYLSGIKRLEREYNLELEDYHVSDIYEF